MIDALTFLYLVLAFGLIPVFVILSMILWRLYKSLDRIDALLVLTEQILYFVKNINEVPTIIANKILSGFNNFIRK